MSSRFGFREKQKKNGTSSVAILAQVQLLALTTAAGQSPLHSVPQFASQLGEAAPFGRRQGRG